MLKRSPPGTFAAIAALRARSAPPALDNVYRFGRFELQPGQRQLLADGRPVGLGQRAFDVLHALVERRARLVTKGELLDVVWPGVVVEENNLQVQISALRKLLGPQVIATIPGRGTGSPPGSRARRPPRRRPCHPLRDRSRSWCRARLERTFRRSCRRCSAATPTSGRCAR